MKKLFLLLILFSSMFNNVLISIADTIQNEITINYEIKNDENKINTEIDFILGENTGFNDETKEYNIKKIVNTNKNEEVSSLNYKTNYEKLYSFTIVYDNIKENKEETKEFKIENEDKNEEEKIDSILDSVEVTNVNSEDIKRINVETVYDISYQSSIGLDRGNNHPKTPLGIILSPNTKLLVREVNPNFSKDLTLKFLTDDSHTEFNSTIKTNTDSWQEITTKEYVTTPFIQSINSQETPIIEYKIEGDYKVLPTYKRGITNQEEFISMWETTNAEYGFIESDIVQFFVPVIDRDALKTNRYGTIEEILANYDKMIDLYNEVTGISYDADNKYDLAPKTKYFVKANKHGAGAAYYSTDHTAYNGGSMKEFFNMGWLTLHEVGHGYEYRLSDQMGLGEVWNNTLANQYQQDNGVKDTDRWLFSFNSRDNYEKSFWDRYKNGVNSFGGLGYREKLNVIVKVIEYAGKEGYSNFNKLYRRFIESEYVNVYQSASDQYVLLFSIATGLNLYDYFYFYGLKASVDVKNLLDNLNLEHVVLLQQVVDLETAKNIKNHFNLLSNYSLISTSQLNEYFSDINANISVTINDSINYNYEVGIYNGTNLVQKQTLVNNQVNFTNIKPGKYTIKVLNDDYSYTFESKNVVIYNERSYSFQINKIENINSSILMQQKITLKGLGNSVFAEINIDGYNKNININSFNTQPHSYYNYKYASVEILSNTGERKYYKEYIGDRKQPSNENVEFQEGDRLIIFHDEGPNGRYSITKKFISEDYRKYITEKTTEYTITKYGLSNESINIKDYNKDILDNYASFIKSILKDDIKNYNKFLEYRFLLKKEIMLFDEEERNNFLVKYGDIINFKKSLATINFRALDNEEVKYQKVIINEKHKLDKNTMKKEGYLFFGWNSDYNNAQKGVVEYDDEDTINISEDITLYGVWKNNFDLIIYGNENNYIKYNYQGQSITALTLGQIKELDQEGIEKVGTFNDFNNKQIKFYSENSNGLGKKFEIGSQISLESLQGFKPRKEDGAIIIYLTFKELVDVNNYSITYESVESGGGNVWLTETFNDFNQNFTFKSGNELNQIKNTNVWTGNGKRIVKWAIRLNNDKITNSPRIKLFDVGEEISIRELFSEWGFYLSQNGNWLRLYPVWEYDNTRIILQNNGIQGWYYKDLNANNLEIKAPNGEEIVNGTSGYGKGSTWLIKEGYDFEEWTRNSDGTGISVKVGENFSYDLIKNEPADRDGLWRFYPNYKKIITIIYYNDTEANIHEEEVLEGNQITLINNPDSKEGYTFEGWSTTKEGIKIYSEGEKIEVSENFKFFPIWEANKYNIIFNGNGNTSGSMENQEFTYDVAQSLSTNKFEKEGYKFVGWNTQADGNGNKYNDEENVINLTSQSNGEVILYAIWERETITINFDGNGNNNTSVSMEPQVVNTYERTILNNNEYVKEGYDFAGWKTLNGTKIYQDNEIVTLPDTDITQDTTLYAQWHPKLLTVTFNANNGTGLTKTQKIVADHPTTLDKNPFAKQGYKFAGWSTTENGLVSYDDEDEVTILNDMNLYAIWLSDNQDIKNFNYAVRNENSWIGDEINGGTFDLDLPINGLIIKSNLDFVEYSGKFHNVGWINNVSTNNSLQSDGNKLEIINLKLKEEYQNQYDIYYRVKTKGFGWLGWAINGAYAGSEGYNDYITGIQIKVINNNEIKQIVNKEISFINTKVKYLGQIESIGWENEWKYDGAHLGTVGRGLRLESIKIALENAEAFNSSIMYKGHVQNIGWQDYVSNGEMSGTEGRGFRIEASQIKLDGDITNYFDIYYRTQVENTGWLDWAKNDELTGSAKYARRIETIQIQLVPKGLSQEFEQNNPHKVEGVNQTFIEQNSIWYNTHNSFEGWKDLNKDGLTVGSGLNPIESIVVSLDEANQYQGGLTYKVKATNGEWSNEVNEGREVGFAGTGKTVEALSITLNEGTKLSQEFDIYYRVLVDGEWLGYAKNGQVAGYKGKKITAIQVILVPKIIQYDHDKAYKDNNGNYAIIKKEDI